VAVSPVVSFAWAGESKIASQDDPPCRVTLPSSQFRQIEGGQEMASMRVRNDGSWCGSSLSAGHAGGAGLNVVLTEAAQHGRSQIQMKDGNTYVLYRAKAGYVGPDRFKVRMQQGMITQVVDVDVFARAL
jgi:hypothetical protein